MDLRDVPGKPEVVFLTAGDKRLRFGADVEDESMKEQLRLELRKPGLLKPSQKGPTAAAAGGICHSTVQRRAVVATSEDAGTFLWTSVLLPFTSAPSSTEQLKQIEKEFFVLGSETANVIIRC